MNPFPEPLSTNVIARPEGKGVRAMDWLLVVIGVLLSGGIAAVALILGNTIAHNNQPGTPTHWMGTPEFTATTFKLFGTVFIFGLSAVLSGIYQIGTGRRHPALAGVMALLFGAVIYFGYVILTTSHPSVS